MTWKKDPELESILTQCSSDTRLLAKTFFGETCSRPFPSITNEIFAAIDNPNINLVAIEAFRSFGKTTIINKMLPARHILFRTKKFIVPISCTATLAQQMGENLKSEMRTSMMVKKMFGDIRTDPTSFSKEMFTAMDTCVMPRGSGQQIRGVLYGRYRPDLIIGDDLEDPEAVKTKDNRDNLRRWFRADVMNSVDRSRNDWKIIVIGTPLHEACFINELLDDPEWYHIKLPLCDENYKSYHPDYMSDVDVKKLAEAYASRGELDIFAMEYMLTVIPPDAPFRNEMFKYYEEDGSMSFDKDMTNIILADPAKTTQMKSAFSAIMTIGVNMYNHMHDYRKVSEKRPKGLYVRDIVNDRFHPEEFFGAIFQMHKATGAKIIGVEVTGLDEYITYPLENYFRERGAYPTFMWLKSPSGRANIGAKTKRVKGLSPWYRQGLVFHNKLVCNVLEHQLMSFPRSKFWDVMDIFGYIVEMLDDNNVFMPADENAEERYASEVERELAKLYSNDDYPNWRMI